MTYAANDTTTIAGATTAIMIAQTLRTWTHNTAPVNISAQQTQRCYSIAHTKIQQKAADGNECFSIRKSQKLRQRALPTCTNGSVPAKRLRLDIYLEEHEYSNS